MTTKHLGDAFERLQSVDIITHQQRCVKVRNRHVTCSKCADACTSHCISLENNRLVIDAEKCIGCGTCCTACPTSALEAANPNDAALFATARRALAATGGTAVFAAEAALEASAGSYDPAKVVPVVNLGRVEESLLVRLAVAGATRIELVLPPQAGEADAMGARTARAVCETANRVFWAWDCETRAEVVEELPACVYNKEGRVQFAIPQAKALSRAAAGADQPAAGTGELVYKTMKVGKGGALPQHSPDRRERLADALFELGEPREVTLETRLWGHVAIDMDRCVGCRLCATFCPTGALKKYADPSGETGIEHALGDCVKCLSCRDVCRENAITVEEAVFAPHVLSGEVERHPMPPEPVRSSSHSMYDKLKGRMGTQYFWER